MWTFDTSIDCVVHGCSDVLVVLSFYFLPSFLSFLLKLLQLVFSFAVSG